MDFRKLAVVLALAAAACDRPTRSGAELAGPSPRATDRVSFLAVGDTGDGRDGQRKVAGEMERDCATRGCDFVTLLGDNLYPAGATSPDDDAFRRLFEEPYARIDRPFFAAIGNHDEGHAGMGLSWERGDVEVAYGARGGKWRMPARFYAVRFERLDLVVLDTDSLMFDRFVDEQRTSVRRWLDGSRAPFRVVVGHHPLRSAGKHGNAGHYDQLPSVTPVAAGRSVRDFVEAEVCGKADVYLSGHDHNLQHLAEACRGTELVVSGAGGSVARLVGGAETRFAKAALGFFRVEVTDEALVLTAVVDGADAYVHRVPRRPRG